MAENVVINIEANTSGLKETIDMLVKMGVVTEDAAKKFKSVNDQTMAGLAKSSAEAKKSFEGVSKAIDNIKQDNGLAKALDVTAPLAKLGNGLTSLKSQLKQATAEAEALARQFGINDERTQAAAASVNKLRSDINNLNAQINALSPEGKFRAIQNVGASIQGVFQIATGSLQAFGIESEKATKIAQQLQGALNITQGLASIGDLKDSFTALAAALGLAKTEAVAAGTALEGEAAAAQVGTVANEEFAASLSVSGIGAVVVAVGALVGAFVLLGNTSHDTAEEQKKLNDELEKTQKLKSATAVQLRDSEILLAVARGDYSRAEGERRQLELDKEEKKKELQNQRQTQYNEYLQSQKEIKQLQEDIAYTQGTIDKGNLGANAQATYEFLANKKKQLKATQETADQQLAIASNTATAIYNVDKTFSNKIEANRLDEANASKNKDKAVVSSSNAATKQLKKNEDEITPDKKYKDALSAIKVFFKQQELLILSSGRTDEEVSKAMLQNQIDNLTAQIAAANTAKRSQEEIIQLEIDLQNLIRKRDKLPEVPLPKVDTTSVSTMPEKVKKGLELQKNLVNQLNEQLITSSTDVISQYFNQWVDGITAVTEKQKEELDNQQKDLDDAYSNRLIGRREYETQEQALILKKAELEKKLKRDQAKADKEKALFDVLMNTASALVRVYIDPGFSAAPLAIPLILATAGVQAAAIAAAPLPKYKKGTLSVPGIGSEDTHHALLTPGEAVIPKDTNARYREAIGAIYHGKISPQDINGFVRMKLKGDYGSSGSKVGPVTAKMDTSDIYTLGKMIKKNDGVYIKNIGELAMIFQSMHNPRR